MFKNFWAILLPFLFVAQMSYGAIPACQEVFELRSRDFPEQFVGIPDGIGHGRLHDQKCGEDCWAQAITEFVESIFKIQSGKDVKLSPEYNLFWHLYLQATLNLRHFEVMRAKYQNESSVKGVYDEAYGLGPTGKANTLMGFQLDVGADAEEAIKKIAFSGVVPSIRYDQAITTDEKESRLESGLAHFIGEFVLKGKNLERYAPEHNAANGVNMALFNDLVTSLKTEAKAITQTPLLPDEEFEYEGKTTTPRKFLVEDIGFNSNEFQYIKTTKQNQKTALAAIAYSLRILGLPVLIGIELFGDDAVWMTEQNEGLFTEQACGPRCKKVTGQHELEGVNYLFKDDSRRPTMIVVQNSWGKIGHRDINGNKTDDPAKMGYYLVSVEYLDRDEKAGPWDLLISKKARLKIIP